MDFRDEIQVGDMVLGEKYYMVLNDNYLHLSVDNKKICYIISFVFQPRIGFLTEEENFYPCSNMFLRMFSFYEIKSPKFKNAAAADDTDDED
jgi:hypothetical protein